MNTSIVTLNIVLLFALFLAANALMYTHAYAQSYDYRDDVRTYRSDGDSSRIRIETRATSDSNAQIKNTVRTYSNSSNNASQVETWSTSLRGSEEVPPVNTPTTGTATLNTHNDETIDFKLTVYDGEDITAAHLHCAPTGENGPVVVSLFSSSNGTDIDGTLREGTITNNDITSNCTGIETVDDLVSEIHQGDIYANVHSKAMPDGLIRGQLNDNGNGGGKNSSNITQNLQRRIEMLIERIKALTQMLEE